MNSIFNLAHPIAPRGAGKQPLPKKGNLLPTQGVKTTFVGANPWQYLWEEQAAKVARDTKAAAARKKQAYQRKRKPATAAKQATVQAGESKGAATGVRQSKAPSRTECGATGD
jgi:hypothetical protein